MQERREFLKNISIFAITPASFFNRLLYSERQLFKISLAQWSLHRAFRAKKIDNLDFARISKSEFEIHAIEYVNQFFKDKANDKRYIAEMKNRAQSEGVKSLLIMCDGEGRLGDPDKKERRKAVENHFKWIEAAKMLGCHSIRVNAASEGTFAEQQKRAADGLAQLTDFATPFKLNVIVENHGGWSSNGEWLAGVMKLVDKPNCGTLPDFGNFRIRDDEWYDRYKGVAELMPFAKAVSAKSNRFDEKGNEIDSDFYRLINIVLSAGYHGYIGIEYEGSELSEYDGVRATKKLLEKVRSELANKK
ncbi:MAG: sugar phosphate isomerase/epimerase [Calditrichaeota bacterium]|nr:MAG: sugar phosphate isomerase/epimerase [Calditrichota bacterium]